MKVKNIISDEVDEDKAKDSMSFYGYKDVIEEGDLVFAYIGRGNIRPITIVKGGQLNTRYGNFEHDRMVGMKYGEQMGGAKGYGYIYLLHPTPEMWSISLPHRTQIVYSPDSSYIIQRLNVTNGSRVIEAGTGSGSFTHSFARTVGLKGRLFTYEFHLARYEEAQRELQDHDMLQNTMITHRDVCKDGFSVDSIPDTFSSNGSIAAEVVFLDLPSPWTAISHLDSVIAKDRRVGICCFSPCIEQVTQTIEALSSNGWINIQMVEVAGKRWEARKDMVRDVNDAIKRLKDIQKRKTQGIEGMKQASTDPSASKRSHNTMEGLDDVKEEISLPKISRLDKGFNPFGKGLRIKEGDETYNWRDVTKVEAEVKSHTSYLTFAYKLPSISTV